MIFTPWNYENAKAVWQEEGYDEGMEEGWKKGIKDTLELFEQGLSLAKIKKVLPRNAPLRKTVEMVEAPERLDPTLPLIAHVALEEMYLNELKEMWHQIGHEDGLQDGWDESTPKTIALIKQGLSPTEIEETLEKERLEALETARLEALEEAREKVWQEDKVLQEAFEKAVQETLKNARPEILEKIRQEAVRKIR